MLPHVLSIRKILFLHSPCCEEHHSAPMTTITSGGGRQECMSDQHPWVLGRRAPFSGAVAPFLQPSVINSHEAFQWSLDVLDMPLTTAYPPPEIPQDDAGEEGANV